MNKHWTRKSLAVIVASVVGASLAGPVAAQQSAPAGKASTATPATTATTAKSGAKDASTAARQVRASQLIGKDVRNAQGEDLGDIRDIIVDVSNARVHYVVLSFGGFLGLGDKLFAFPLRAFKPSADRDELILTVDRARLKDAPGFADRDNWPDFNSGEFRTSVDRYFGPNMTMTVASSARMVRTSELIGKDVNDPSGKDMGEIEDVVLNMGNGDVRYAVLEFDQSWSLQEKLFALPLKAFKIGERWNDDLVLNVTKDKLNNTPGFDKASWPKMNINDPKYVSDIDRYLVTTAVVPLPSTSNDALFVRLDANKDGSLSSEEVKNDASVQSNWKKIDADSNGRVTREEFNAAYRK